MSNDFDFDLSPDQWETLRALRNPVSNGHLSKAYLLDSLVKLGLVIVSDGVPAMTPAGRKVTTEGLAMVATAFDKRLARLTAKQQNDLKNLLEKIL